jgi:hypothetical protein
MMSSAGVGVYRFGKDRIPAATELKMMVNSVRATEWEGFADDAWALPVKSTSNLSHSRTPCSFWGVAGPKRALRIMSFPRRVGIRPSLVLIRSRSFSRSL